MKDKCRAIIRLNGEPHPCHRSEDDLRFGFHRSPHEVTYRNVDDVTIEWGCGCGCESDD